MSDLRLRERTRLLAISPVLTDLRSDPVLDELVARLAARLDAPFAAVVIVLSRVALFRVATGLPPELQVSRAVSRASVPDDTVVREHRPLLVTELGTLNGPQRTLAAMFDLRSYATVPLEFGSHVVGTVAVAHTRARAFDDGALSVLGEFAALARERFAVLEQSACAHDEIASENELPLVESAALSRLALARRSGALEEPGFERGLALLSQLEDRHFRWQELVAALRPLAQSSSDARSIMKRSEDGRSGRGDR
jgi:hypothetical protein